MTLNISVNVPDARVDDGTACDYLARALAAIGYARSDERPVGKLPALAAPYNGDVEQAMTLAEGIAAAEAAEGVSEESLSATDTEQPADDTPAGYVRPRGKPHGKESGRRTKAEITEDDEIERLAKEASIKLDAVDEQLAKGVTREAIVDELNKLVAQKDPAYRPREAEEKANISSGEERVDPAEIAAQDAADEAAETAATKTGLTLDDLRHAAARYKNAFGGDMAAMVKDIPEIIGSALVEVPEDKIAEAVAKVDEAIKLNPFGRTRTAASEPAKAPETKVEEPTATLDELKAAATTWAQQFPQSNSADIEALTAKGSALITSALGPIPDGTKNGQGVVVTRWVLSAVPDDAVARGKCVAAFKGAGS